MTDDEIIDAIIARIQQPIADLIARKIDDAVAALPSPPDHTALAAAVLQDTARADQALALINDLAVRISDYINGDRYTITRRQVLSILKEIQNG